MEDHEAAVQALTRVKKSSNRNTKGVKCCVDRFIAHANIAHFQDLLARETDPEKRRVIEGLLALEQQKLKAADLQARKQSRGSGNPRSVTDPSR